MFILIIIVIYILSIAWGGLLKGRTLKRKWWIIDLVTSTVTLATIILALIQLSDEKVKNDHNESLIEMQARLSEVIFITEAMLFEDNLSWADVIVLDRTRTKVKRVGHLVWQHKLAQGSMKESSHRTNLATNLCHPNAIFKHKRIESLCQSANSYDNAVKETRDLRKSLNNSRSKMKEAWMTILQLLLALTLGLHTGKAIRDRGMA